MMMNLYESEWDWDKPAVKEIERCALCPAPFDVYIIKGKEKTPVCYNCSIVVAGLPVDYRTGI